MQINILASGSHANCMVVELDGVTIMLDAGLAYRDTVERMAAAGVDPENVSAILCTHAHRDHSGSLKTVARKFGIPVYMTHGCFSEIKPKEMPANVVRFRPGQSFKIGTLRVTPFLVPHDAWEPVAFKLGSGGEVFTMATDLGSIPADLANALRDADTVMIESNYEESIVRLGEKHPAVIRRVTGELGHLSNDQVAAFLKQHANTQKQIILGHLSEGDNDSRICRLTAERAADGRVPVFLAEKNGGISAKEK